MVQLSAQKKELKHQFESLKVDGSTFEVKGGNWNSKLLVLVWKKNYQEKAV